MPPKGLKTQNGRFPSEIAKSATKCLYIANRRFYEDAITQIADENVIMIPSQCIDRAIRGTG